MLPNNTKALSEMSTEEAHDFLRQLRNRRTSGDLSARAHKDPFAQMQQALSVMPDKKVKRKTKHSTVNALDLTKLTEAEKENLKQLLQGSLS